MKDRFTKNHYGFSIYDPIEERFLSTEENYFDGYIWKEEPGGCFYLNFVPKAIAKAVELDMISNNEIHRLMIIPTKAIKKVFRSMQFEPNFLKAFPYDQHDDMFNCDPKPPPRKP